MSTSIKSSMVWRLGAVVVDPSIQTRPFWQIVRFVKSVSQSNRMSVADEDKHIHRLCSEFRIWRRNQVKETMFRTKSRLLR